MSQRIQVVFPHRCPGFDCKVCWWVAGREDEQEDRRHHLLARLEYLIGIDAAKIEGGVQS